jgi:allantoate deiminase
MSAPAVAADPALTARLAAAVAEHGLPVVTLPSGAGHDAVALAELTGVAMLFVRCAGGVSHHPDESVDEADVAVALDVLHTFVRGLAR